MDMRIVAQVAGSSPAEFLAMATRNGWDANRIAVDQGGPHFRRCVDDGVCPWEAVAERIVVCDGDCGPFHGCAVVRGRIDPSAGTERPTVDR